MKKVLKFLVKSVSSIGAAICIVGLMSYLIGVKIYVKELRRMPRFDTMKGIQEYRGQASKLEID